MTLVASTVWQFTEVVTARVVASMHGNIRGFIRGRCPLIVHPNLLPPERKRRCGVLRRGFSFPSVSRFFIGNPKVFKYFWTPDRSIQGQAKSGSKVAGVTKKE